MKGKDCLRHLGSAERARVLMELLGRHPDLSEEANAIAQNLIDDVSVEAVAEEVADLVTGIGYEEIGSRAGRRSWGYVEPTEAAWELLEESIENVRADMKRRFDASTEHAAEKICQGIIIGLYGVRNGNSDGALGWGPTSLPRPRPSPPRR